MVNALLLKLMQKIYPNCTRNQLIGRFWRKQPDGSKVFTLTSNPNIKVTALANTVLLKAKEIDISKNPYLDKDYFDELEDTREIRNVTGRYKKIWEMQNGKCYICKREIKSTQEKAIMYKNITKKPTFRNMAYIHENCKDSEIRYIKLNEYDFNYKDFYELVEEFENDNHTQKVSKKVSKFDKLTTYFHNVRKTKVTMKFSDIEKIIGSKLCSSAYKYKSYFYNNKDEGSISNSWLSQGYRITKIDLEERKIFFEKDTQNKPRVMLPDYLFKEKIPHNAKVEIEDFLVKMKEKYRL